VKVLKMDEDFDDVEMEEILDDDVDFDDSAAKKQDKKPGKAREALILLQEVCGFEIFLAARSFVVRKVGSTQNMYFTTLAACVREISNQTLADKAANRDHYMKKNIDSLMGVIEHHEKLMQKIVAELDGITVKSFAK
jgi:hypothetical protein